MHFCISLLESLYCEEDRGEMTSPGPAVLTAACTNRKAAEPETAGKEGKHSLTSKQFRFKYFP